MVAVAVGGVDFIGGRVEREAADLDRIASVGARSERTAAAELLTNLPSVVNFSTMLSPLPFPDSQTKPLLSTRIACSCAGQS